MGAFDDWIGQPETATPEPLTTPATRAEPSRSSFGSWFDGPSEQDAKLGSSLNAAASTTPDAHQKAVDIGSTIGAPPDAVAANLKETERLARIQKYRDALNDAPKMAALLAEDPDLAKLSADDIERLAPVENTFTKMLSSFYGLPNGTGQKAADVGRAGAGGLVGDVFGSGFAGLAELNEIAGRTIERGMRAVGLDTAADALTSPIVPWWLSPTGILRRPGEALKEVGEDIKPPEERQNIATDIAGGVGQVVGQIGLALVSGGTATVAMLLGSGADQLAERVEQQGKAGTPEGDAAIAAGAAVTAVTEHYGLHLLLERVPINVKNRILSQLADITVAGGIEALQEVTEGILQNVVELVTVNPDAKILDGVEQDATAAGGTGAFIRAIVNAATKGRQISHNAQRQQRAAADAAVIDSLVKGTADSTLRDRNADAFSRVMAAQTQGTPVETFYVPAEKIAELYQERGAAPFAMDDDPLSQIDGLRDQFAEALAVGGDVEISAADYLTHVAGSDLHGALKNDLRASRDGWSVNEAREYSQNPDREAELQSLVERLALQDEGAAVGQATFDDVYTQLMNTGRYESRQAAAQAALIRERYVARAARLGTGADPDALYLRDQVRILGPGALASVRKGDLDLVIARLKSGETVQGPKTPVLDIVRAAGGVKIGSQLDQELRAMGLTPKTHPGLFKSTGGIGDVDNFVLSEHDVLRDNGIPDSGNGYADRDAVLEALRVEAGGRGAALQTQDQRDQAAKLDEPVSVLAEQLEAAGLDPKAMTEQEIRDWVSGQAELGPGGQQRPAEPAADDQGVLFQRTAPPLGTDPKEAALTVVDILYGDTPAIKANTREVGDIARELMTRGQKALRALGVKGGVIEGPDPKTDEILSRAIATEIKAALEKSSRNASDWYTRKVEEALTIAALMHPEIATDPVAEMGFTAALAITSQGETVPSNVRLADPIYRHFRETGRFPTTVQAKNGPAMAANFKKLNELLDARGPEGTREFLHSRFTVGDLKKAGYPIGGENVSTVVYGSAILGPKIGGGFFQNLNRNYSPVTMDLWFMRAWGRISGTLVGNTNPESLAKQKDRLTTALEADGRKVPKTKAALDKVAEEITAAHERDFRTNRKQFDSGEKTKSELTYAAERYLIGLNGINEQPRSGSDRIWMRERVARAQELLRQEGISLTAADLQAVWWYPEKDLYAKLGGRDSEAINVDYAGALSDLARSKGIDDDTITRAVGSLDQRSGSARTGDDGRAIEGRGAGDQGSGAAGTGTVLFQAAGPNAGRDLSGDLGNDPAQQSAAYARGSTGDAGPLHLGSATVAARWEPNAGGPVMLELDPGDAAAQTFSAAIQASKVGSPYGAAVYVYPNEDYAGMRLFLTEDRLAGIGLKGDDIVSVFNTPGSPHKNVAVDMVKLAVQEGGRRLDAFDTVLPGIYAKAGFSVAARLPWDESQMPDGWDKAAFGKYNGGTPDVVFMALTGREPPYVAGEGPYAADYDEAVRLQREAVDAREDPGRDVETDDAGAGSRGGADRAQADLGPLPRESAATLGSGSPDRYPERLANLPARSPGPIQAIRDAAASYMRSIGLPVRTQSEHVVADPVRGKRIADAYDAMAHAPQDPEVAAAYRAMIDETLAQYQIVKQLGITVEVIEPGMPDPYPEGPMGVIKDMHRGHLWLFPTDAGFGTLTEIADNPLLEPTDEFIGDRRLVANDIFRIVHDVFGHGKEGVGFGPSGEENAWQSHVLMYSPLAARAMTSETRGQNSWVNFGPYGEANRSNQRETVYADQKVGLLPEWASTEAIAAKPLDELSQGVKGSYQRALDPYGNPANIVRLTQGADLSTALHEFGHFFLFQLIDDSFDPSADPEARAKLQADLQKILDHVGIQIDVATASADAVHAAMTREAHELWARSFEVYLRDGKAPSSALRDAFASFSAWLTRIYKTLTSMPDYRRQITPEVRGVMDRLVATDEAIADAEAAASFRVPSALRSVMTASEQKSLERLSEQATREAREELQKRVMRELERERREWWKEERAKVRAEVERDVRNRPVYAAYNLLRYGITASGETLVDEAGNPRKLKLDRNLLSLDYGKDVLKLLPKGVTAKDGISHHVFAGMMGFSSADELRDALLNVQPMRDVIEAETDAAMKQRHGDMLSDGRIAEDAAEVVLNEKQLELAALQAKALRRLAASVVQKAATRTVAETGAGTAAADRAAVNEAVADVEAVAGTGAPADAVAGPSVAADMARASAAAGTTQRTAQRAALRQVRGLQTKLDAKAIAAAAKRAMAGKRVEDAVPGRYRTQADRLARQVEQAIAKRDYETAARLKEQQLINLALAREAQAVQDSVGKALKRFGRLRKPDSNFAKSTDIEFIGAARAILSRFGLSSPQQGFDSQVWFEKMQENDPAGAADMRSMIDAATAGAGTVAARGRPRTRQRAGGQPVDMAPDIWRQMTVDEFRSLTDTVDALLTMGRNAKTIEVEGQRVEIKAAVSEMIAQASGRDSGKRIGQTAAVTDAEKRARSFWGMAAFLERVESWARRLDDGKVGPFTKYFVRPVLSAVYEYRAEKTRRIKQLVDILEPRKKELLGKPIAAPELNYTFANKGALLHAILHTGNDSNMRKLLLGGRGEGFAWGKAMPDGTVDRSRWDSMIRRMVQDGILTKQDFDTAQQIWDLLEELKGPAQVAHRKMKGYYFQEVETPGIDTPFGKYRGGYVPAVTERLLNADAGARVDAAAMGEMQNAGILPSVAKGFTKSRVEYNKPLELNLSRLTGHVDTVLKFTHLGPVVAQVTRLAINREFKDQMFGIDPHAVDEILIPWLQRVARQTVEIPFTSEGGRTFGKFFKGLQKHTGIQAMAGNILNAAQQITGLNVAMIKVRPTRVLRGLVASVAAPRHSSQMIMAKSAYMRDRMDSTSQELMTTLDDLLEEKSVFRKLRDKTDKHGYFAQIYMQNLVDRAVWLGSYEQNVAKGMAENEAVLEADSVVRTTQGSFAPEDVSRVEVQNAFARPFLQFYSYFNAQYNVLRQEFDSTIQDLGWARGSPRLFYIYLMGALVPAVLAEAMSQAARGELGDDDDDGLIDDIGELFALSQLRYFAAMIPIVGTAVNFGVHLFNDKPYDDRLSVAPVVSQVERLGGSAVKLATGGESTAGRAVQDALTLIGMLTGLPLGQLGKPLGYTADVMSGEQQGADIIDWTRGLLSGREAPKQ